MVIMTLRKEIIPKKKQKLTYLQWQDAHSSSSWYSLKELTNFINEEVCIIEQIGWVIYEDKKEIHLVPRRLLWDWKGEVHEYGLPQRIPKTWIMKRKRIIL